MQSESVGPNRHLTKQFQVGIHSAELVELCLHGMNLEKLVRDAKRAEAIHMKVTHIVPLGMHIHVEPGILLTRI